MNFTLYDLNPDFWSKVQAKAQAEGVTVKAVILRLLTQWLGVLALVVMFPTSGSAQSLRLPAFVLGATGAADMATTAIALTNGSGLTEGNPAVNWIKSPARMLTFGAAVEITAVALVVNKLAPRHPKWAAAGLYIASGIHAYATIHNLRNMQKRPGR